MAGKIDHTVKSGGGPYVYRMHGQNYHIAGSLLPQDGESPRFCQLSNKKKKTTSNESMANPFSLEFWTIHELMGLLDFINPLVKQFRMARDRFGSNPTERIRLKLIGSRENDGRQYNLPTTNEVAALIIGDIDGYDSRDIVLETQSRQLQRINELHPQYLALQYPLLFPYAEDGFRVDILHRGVEDPESDGRIRWTMREFFAYRIQQRTDEISLILRSRKLFQQFLVDSYTMVENERLSYISFNQPTLRVAPYRNLAQAAEDGIEDASLIENRIIIPSSFTGGSRYMQQNYLDAMTLVKWFGYPDLFLTLTCNPKWPEVIRFVEAENLKLEDRPDILTRIFKIKLDSLISQLKDKKLWVKSLERGLPHCHVCLFLEKNSKIPNPEDIERVICAELPDKDSELDLYQIVCDNMIHGPCGNDQPFMPCMKKGKCSKRFPREYTDHTYIDEDGYPIYRRRNDGNNVLKKGVSLDNRNVVPYNKILMKQYQAHMNVEWCSQVGSIKYLFKYINKGPDRITTSIVDPTKKKKQQIENNDDEEIGECYNCRYISACEACWRLFAYDIHYRTPPVERLSFHLENKQPVVFKPNQHLNQVVSKPTVAASQFLAWMECNKHDEDARKLSYVEFPTKYVWNKSDKIWTKRKTKSKALGRLNHVSPKAGDIYYLRILLNKIKGPTSYEDIKTINGIVHDSYKDACYALGLLDDNREYISSINETHHWATTSFCRSLFVMLITSDSLSSPAHVFEETYQYLSDDVIHVHEQEIGVRGLKLKEDAIFNLTLSYIEKSLLSCGLSLKQIPNMSFPDHRYIQESCNMLIQDELNYDPGVIEVEHQDLYSKLNVEQKNVYHTVMNAVNNNQGGVFFLYGYGGTRKTFVWKTLSAAIRSKGEIVINVASSGIAALFLPGGRTAHSRFIIPINLTENSFCSIAPDSDLAALLNKARLIIWDEAPMMHRHCFEAFDRTLRDIVRSFDRNKAFGGKTIVFGGDFRQILPVIQRGNHSDIVQASLHSSRLWSECTVLRLTVNMRLQVGCPTNDLDETKAIAEWILKIGEGNIGGPNDGEAEVEFPEDVIIRSTCDHIHSIISTIYPSFENHLDDPSYFQDKAILVPTNEEVDAINDYMLGLMKDEGKTYLSSDSLCETESADCFEESFYSSDVLNAFKASGIPNHKLTLKTGVPVMLLRNIDQTKGLCNGTRLQIVRLGKHVIEARIIAGRFFNETTYIPRMKLTPSDKRIPFRF
ncbi:uncharacterized protein LOC111889982 [Lactuca sativa]|uniref:uncharacterized protein LOC111889982 n=1 Tax=Lactuca sativa TaxID=4236 RepID=UPI0022B07A49|nr:uncharacterized protein LOC111889982 [Lactuca sativa]